MYHLTHFSLKDMTECGAALRKLGIGAASMEAVANHLVQYLYEQFRNEKTGEPSFALVRLFKTHAYGDLRPELQQIVDALLAEPVQTPTMKCLTLLATRGDRPEWNQRHTSVGHQAIPLVSAPLVAQSPMISQLMQQFGIDIGTLLAPDTSLMIDLEQKTYNVFHIQEALNNPYVPAQKDFVVPYGIRSVLGFGGILPSGHLMAVILFSKESISRETADMFKTLALNAKMALLPFDPSAVFA